MGRSTGIAWTDATVNFWWGCTKVGPGCDHCYAETLADRFYPGHWGSGAPRRKIKTARTTLQRLDNLYSEWSADAECARGNARAFGLPVPNVGNRRRVFIQSMSDFFDNEVPQEWRAEAWKYMVMSDRLTIQLLTKRIGNVGKMIDGPWPSHIGLLVTVCNQEEADRDIPKLLALKVERHIPWVGVSAEPLLGPIDLRRIDPSPRQRGAPAKENGEVIDSLAGQRWLWPSFSPKESTEKINWVSPAPAIAPWRSNGPSCSASSARRPASNISSSRIPAPAPE
jgi:protein gp37